MARTTSVRRAWELRRDDPLGLAAYRLVEPSCALDGTFRTLVNWVGPPTARIWLLAETLKVDALGNLDVEVYQRDCDNGPVRVVAATLAVPSLSSSGALTHYAGTLCTAWEVRVRLAGGATAGTISLAAWVDRGFQRTETVPGLLSSPST